MTPPAAVTVMFSSFWYMSVMRQFFSVSGQLVSPVYGNISNTAFTIRQAINQTI